MTTVKKKQKTIEDKIMDRLDHALVSVRQSTPESLTPILLNLKKSLDNHIDKHESDVKMLNEKIESIKEVQEKNAPILQGLSDTFTGGKFLNRVMSWIAKFLLTVGVISTAVLWLKDWVRK